MVPHIRCSIRWPNDVILGHRKICGILPELVSHSHDLSRFVLGIGVNLNNSLCDAPTDVRSTGTSLIDLTGSRADPTQFLIQLLGNLFSTLSALSENAPELGVAWSKRCYLRGRTVHIRAGHRVRGQCCGMDYDGALVLVTSNGTQRFTGGQIEIYSESSQDS